jgi:hypothetical protein
VRLRAPGENVENQRRAIEDLDLEHLLQIAKLRRGELVVDDDQVVLEGLLERLDLFELPGAEVGSGDWMGQALCDRADDFDVGGFGEACKLFE